MKREYYESKTKEELIQIGINLGKWTSAFRDSFENWTENELIDEIMRIDYDVEED